MNIMNGDYQGLLGQISIAADKSFNEDQIIALIDLMQTLGWSGSYRVTMQIVRSAAIPRNVYGLVINLLDEEMERQRAALREKESWRAASEDAASSKEYALTMRCIRLISRLKNPKTLLERFGGYLDEAVSAGRLLETLEKSESFYAKQLDNPAIAETDGRRADL
jgi:hypothetical protein